MRSKKFLINTDHDRTLNTEYTHLLAARLNPHNDPYKFAKKLFTEGLIYGDRNEKRAILQEEDARKYLKKIGKKEFETLEDITTYATFAFAEKKLSGEEVGTIINSSLVGITKEDLKNIQDAAIGTVTKGANKYSKWIREQKGYHIIMSDGFLQIAKAVARAVGNVDFVFGKKMIFEDGIFKGRVSKFSKCEEAFKFYKSLGFSPENGVYKFTVAVDDSALNLDYMKKHDLCIAFCPTKSDEKIFAKEGSTVRIIKEKNFENVITALEQYLYYANARYK